MPRVLNSRGRSAAADVGAAVALGRLKDIVAADRNERGQAHQADGHDEHRDQHLEQAHSP